MKTELTRDFHLHHIKPRKLGGTDEPDNLVLLHPIDHAIWHLVRYRQLGWQGDLYAAKILMGSLGEDGMPISTHGVNVGELNPMWGRRGELHPGFGKKGPNAGKKIHSDEFKQKQSKRWQENNPGPSMPGDLNPARRPEVREKMSKPRSITPQYPMSCILCRHSVTPQTIKNHYQSRRCQTWAKEIV